MKVKSLERIFKQLYHPNPIVRKNAAQYLSQLAPKEATVQIQLALQNESEIKVAKWLALALAKIGDPNAIESISVALASSPDNEERDWLLLAQAVLKEDSERARIKDLLKSNSVDNLKQAAQLLWAGKGDATTEMRKLIKLAEHEDSGVRRWSILAMGKGKSKSVDPIKHALKDSDYLVREWTECTLAQYGEKTPPALLIPGLDDDHPRVREWAIKALAATRRPEIPEILINRLKTEKDLECREAIYRSLASLQNEEGVQSVIQSAMIEELNPSVLMAVIDLLATSPAARENNDLLEGISRVCTQNDRDLLSPYLVERLYNTSSNLEKDALDILIKSPSNIFLLKEMTNTDIKTIHKSEHNMTIGILIALKEEFRVFSEIVKNLKPLENEGYYGFKIDWPNLKLSGICKLIGEKGATRAMVATKELIDIYKPDVIVNIGIAASIDSELLLGDVIVATQVTDYLHDSKAIGDGSNWEFRLSGDPYPIDYGLLSQALNFEFSYPGLYKEWRNQCANSYIEYLDTKVGQRLREINSLRNYPEVMECKVASGPTVGASTEFVKWLKNRGDRSWKALEMESVGVAAAATLTKNRKPSFVIRGVSDFADERKNELEIESNGSIRKIAMANATCFALFLLAITKI